MNYFYYIPFDTPFYFSFRNCCAATKEKEKRIAKMCVKSAKIDYVIYMYILNDLGIIGGENYV